MISFKKDIQTKYQKTEVKYQTVNSKNMHASNLLTQQVIFRNIHTYTNTYFHAIIIDEKEAMNLEERGEGHI